MRAVEADDPARNRCGCFLPDLTRLATAPSADFRAGIWAKRPRFASSASEPVFIDGSSQMEDPRLGASIFVPFDVGRRSTFAADRRDRASLGALHQSDGRTLPVT